MLELFTTIGKRPKDSPDYAMTTIMQEWGGKNGSLRAADQAIFWNDLQTESLQISALVWKPRGNPAG